MIGSLNDINSLRGGAATSNILGNGILPTRVAQLVVDANASPIDSQVIDGIFTQLSSVQLANSGWLSQLQRYCQTYLAVMAAQDTSQTAPPLSFQQALAILIQQMTGVATVVASVPAAGAQTAVGSPVGNPVVVIGVNAGDGHLVEYMLPETLTFRCSLDSNSGAVVNQEQFTITGLTPIPDPLSWLWPGGSGATLQVTSTDYTKNNSGGNNLVNSDFETWTTANVPDNWTILAGSAGTQILKDTSNPLTGLASLEFVGNATGASIAQKFNTSSTPTVASGGTPFNPAENVNYAVSLWYKLSAGSPAAGVLRVSLVDGSNTIVNDTQGNANSATVTLTGVGDTSYHNKTFIFRPPTNKPATLKLRFDLSTALSVGTSLFIDTVACRTMQPLYQGAPYSAPQIAVFAALTPPVNGDSWTAAMTNTFGLFQKAFQRLFSISNLGMILPSATSGAETIHDNLIS